MRGAYGMRDVHKDCIMTFLICCSLSLLGTQMTMCVTNTTDKKALLVSEVLKKANNPIEAEEYVEVMNDLALQGGG